jgi:hypothetical protein
MAQSLGSNKIIFDGRNLYDSEFIQNIGFYYVQIGKNINK